MNLTANYLMTRVYLLETTQDVATAKTATQKKALEEREATLQEREASLRKVVGRRDYADALTFELAKRVKAALETEPSEVAKRRIATLEELLALLPYEEW